MLLNIDYKILDLNNNEDPTSFFNFCLKNKLYKDEIEAQDDSFISHMKIVYENKKEIFKGCLAVLAFYDNNPIGIAFIQKNNTFLPLNKKKYEYYEKNNFSKTNKFLYLNEEKNKSNYPIHLGGTLFLDSRNRNNIWKHKFNFQFLHFGFLMLYVKPEFRKNGITNNMLKLIELKIGEILKNDLINFPLIVKNYTNKTYVTITAKEDAFLISNKKFSFINPIESEPYYNSFIQKISQFSYNIAFENDIKLKTLNELIENYDNNFNLLLEKVNLTNFLNNKNIKSYKIKLKK